MKISFLRRNIIVLILSLPHFLCIFIFLSITLIFLQKGKESISCRFRPNCNLVVNGELSVLSNPVMEMVLLPFSIDLSHILAVEYEKRIHNFVVLSRLWSWSRFIAIDRKIEEIQSNKKGKFFGFSTYRMFALLAFDRFQFNFIFQ